ncbi:AAA family ATPase [Nonomuraea sp. NPDC049655]|uniref:AAA family ATPase n=1 Tax=Nonomuraea sp. NPDC049655 TaxID=3364355 RepID=UPI0037BD416D
MACIGTACHIYAAAPGGPRGTGGLPFDQLQSASNGIWLCADHARLIDTNQGQGYPAQLLLGWRQLHENYLVQEMRGLVAPGGLVTGITIHQGPAALASRSVTLSALNVVVGYNGTGKSILLDLLASVAQSAPFGDRRWVGDLAADIHWFDPQPHMLRLQARDSRIRFKLDHKPVPFVPAPYRPIIVRTPRNHLTELRELAELLDLDANSFRNLLFEVPDRVCGEVSSVEITDGTPLVHLRSWPEPVRLEGHLSSAVVWTVLFETAIALAQVLSQTGPTLLLIDDFGDFLHPLRVDRMFKLLTDATLGFQTVVVTHSPLPAEIQQNWSITSFIDDEYNTLIPT